MYIYTGETSTANVLEMVRGLRLRYGLKGYPQGKINTGMGGQCLLQVAFSFKVGPLHFICVSTKEKSD